MAYYGDEDLYFKPSKPTVSELQEKACDIKKYRLMLINILNDEETVQQAINRLKGKSKDKNKNKKRKISNNDPIPDNEQYMKLLDIISNLTNLGFYDVYTDKKDDINAFYSDEINGVN